MKTAAICIDAWKLTTFKRNLEAAGYAFTEHPGITADTITIKVKTDLIAPLQKVVEKAQRECRP